MIDFPPKKTCVDAAGTPSKVLTRAARDEDGTYLPAKDSWKVHAVPITRAECSVLLSPITVLCLIDLFENGHVVDPERNATLFRIKL